MCWDDLGFFVMKVKFAMVRIWLMTLRGWLLEEMAEERN